METRKAVQQLSSGKAPGADAINAEVYAFGVCVWGGGVTYVRENYGVDSRRLSRKTIRMHP